MTNYMNEIALSVFIAVNQSGNNGATVIVAVKEDGYALEIASEALQRFEGI